MNFEKYRHELTLREPEELQQMLWEEQGIHLSMDETYDAINDGWIFDDLVESWRNTCYSRGEGL